MSAVANIVSFPVDAESSDFLRRSVGPPADKLDAVALRLTGLEALVAMAKEASDLPPLARNALMGIELALRDCLGMIDAVPVKVDNA